MKQQLKNIWANPRRLLLAIFLLAFGARLAFSLTLDRDKWYFYDTVHYDKAARSLLAGEGFGSGYYFSSMEDFQDEYSLPPVYPIFLAAVYNLFGRDFLAVRVVQSIIGALTCLIIFSIGKRIFDDKVGLLAAFACAVYPFFIFIGGMLYVTGLFMLFIALFVLLLLKSLDDDSFGALALSGLFLGLATLSGPILFALYPLVALWILVIIKKTFTSKLKATFVVFAAAILTLAPWSIRNYQIFGRITPVSASVDWFLADAQSRVENELSVRAFPDSIGNRFDIYIKDRFSGALLDSAKNYDIGSQRHAGIVLRGGYSNNIEELVAKKYYTNGSVDSNHIEPEVVVDDFERETLGSQWLNSPVFELFDGEFKNSSTDRKQDFLAVFLGIENPSEVTIKWDEDTEASGVSQTGVAFLTSSNLNSNGYMIKREPFGLLELRLIENGTPTKLIMKKMSENLEAASNGENHTSSNPDSKGIFAKVLYIVTSDFRGFLSHYSSEFLHFWQLYPDRVTTKNEFTDIKTIIISVASFAPVLVFGIIGFVSALPKWRSASLIFFVIMSFALGYAFFQTRVRYRIPIEPYMIIFAAYGFIAVANKIKKRMPESR